MKIPRSFAQKLSPMPSNAPASDDASEYESPVSGVSCGASQRKLTLSVREARSFRLDIFCGKRSGVLATSFLKFASTLKISLTSKRQSLKCEQLIKISSIGADREEAAIFKDAVACSSPSSLQILSSLIPRSSLFAPSLKAKTLKPYSTTIAPPFYKSKKWGGKLYFSSKRQAFLSEYRTLK